MLQATDAFPRARCIQDAVDKGVRGNVVPRPAPLPLLFPERASQGNPVPLNKEDFLDGGNPLPLNKEDFLDDGNPVPPDRDELSGIFYFCCPFKNPSKYAVCWDFSFCFLKVVEVVEPCG